jgi:hypothetical protein
MSGPAFGELDDDARDLDALRGRVAAAARAVLGSLTTLR